MPFICLLFSECESSWRRNPSLSQPCKLSFPARSLTHLHSPELASTTSATDERADFLTACPNSVLSLYNPCQFDEKLCQGILTSLLFLLLVSFLEWIVPLHFLFGNCYLFKCLCSFSVVSQHHHCELRPIELWPKVQLLISHLPPSPNSTLS
jgi:hypothetical protein